MRPALRAPVAKLACACRRRIQYGSRMSRRFRSESTASGTGKHLFSSGRQQRAGHGSAGCRLSDGVTKAIGRRALPVMNCHTAMPLTALCAVPCNRIARGNRRPSGDWTGNHCRRRRRRVHEFYSSLRGCKDTSNPTSLAGGHR